MSWLVLDASRYQTFNDYSAAALELDGVVLRCGLRGYSSGALSKDAKLDTHYNGFYGKMSKAGISMRMGFYFYSCAISDEEAEEEAEYIYTILNGKSNDFPIFIYSAYGTEDRSGRADYLTAEQRTRYLVVLGNKLKEYGYRIGVFATQGWLTTELDYTIVVDAGFYIWAIDDATPTIDNYVAWRYTDDGIIDGISSKVSLSYVYEDIANWADTKININTLDAWIISPVEYSGKEITETTVGIDGLTYLVDYDVTFCNASIASTLAYALLEGKGIYTGTKSVPYTILPADINKLDIHLKSDGYRYTGEPIKPEIVYDKTTDLGKSFSSSQYDIRYIDNIGPGEGIVKVQGKNNYQGTVELHFYIEGEVPFPTRPILEDYTFTYTGDLITPRVIVGDLEEGVDFTTWYENNVAVGTALVRVTGINNYEGDSEELHFNIEPLNIGETGSIRYKQTRFFYTADYQNPEFYFTCSKGDIIYNPEANVDYTYSYSNNLNVGKGRITIQAISKNYTGVYYGYFDIEPANISDCDVYLDKDKYEYTGAPIEPVVNILFNEHHVSANDYTVVYSNNIKVGTDAQVSVIGRNNFTGNYKTYFEITTKSGDEDYWMLDQVEYTYTGEPCTPTPICVNDDPEEGRDYTVAYENNVNAGVGKCIVTMIGNYSYKKVYLLFLIYPQELDLDSFSLDHTEFIYNKQYIEPEVLCTKDYILGVDYKLEYKHNKYPDEGAFVDVIGINNYTGIRSLYFHISKFNIEEYAYIDMGDPVKYDNMYDPKNFALKTTTGETLVLYDDYIYDFKTITFERNITYTYTIYIVTGIGSCTGTITKGFYTTVEGYEPEIPVYVPKEQPQEELVTDPVEDNNPDDIISEDIPVEEELKEPTYVDPYAVTENFLPDIDPVIPDDPPGVEHPSGELVYIKRCKYYSSPYTKFPEAELLNGSFYIYSFREVEGKIRVTLDPMSAKIVGRTTGWIPVEEIGHIFHVKLGDKVIVNNYIWADQFIQQGRIFKKDQEMYVTSVPDYIYSSSDVCIGLSNKPNLNTIGWVSVDMIDIP